MWTAVIVAQVASTVAFPAIVYAAQSDLRHIQTLDTEFAGEMFLTVRIEMDAPVVPRSVRPISRRK